MRVLWFSLTPSNFAAQRGGYNGCGWISSLETAISKREDVELGIAFFDRTETNPVTIGRTTYFPMRRAMSKVARIDRFFRISAQDRVELGLAKEVVEQFRPDVIQVFGTESSFGLLAGETDIPVVIHLQGLLGPSLNAWVPPGYDMADYANRGHANPLQTILGMRAIAFNRHAAARERRIMNHCRYFMGRTEWDRAFVSAFAPQARYFKVWETLRPCFYESAEWKAPQKPVFVSTVSGPLYKGHDMIIKTAKTLRDSGQSDFKWRVFGVPDLSLAERKTGIRAKDVGVVAEGVVSAEELREALLGASVYVHPSYIDNSPNSVCEAQILGVPVVATNVGGVSSLFSPDHANCLVPPNDPLMAASAIRKAILAPESFIDNRDSIRRRHDPAAIAESLTYIWHGMVLS